MADESPSISSVGSMLFSFTLSVSKDGLLPVTGAVVLTSPSIAEYGVGCASGSSDISHAEKSSLWGEITSAKDLSCESSTDTTPSVGVIVFVESPFSERNAGFHGSVSSWAIECAIFAMSLSIANETGDGGAVRRDQPDTSPDTSGYQKSVGETADRIFRLMNP